MNNPKKFGEKGSIKRAMFVSALSMMMCVVMLIGTTFAWFTDSISNQGNTITAGNLSMKLTACDAASNWVQDPVTKVYSRNENALGSREVDVTKWDILTNGPKASTQNYFSLFKEENFEPNKSNARYLRVENTGTLPIDFRVDIMLDVMPSDTTISLADVMKFHTELDAPVYQKAAYKDWETTKTLSKLIEADPSHTSGSIYKIYDSKEKTEANSSVKYWLDKDESAYIRVDYLMCPWAPNTYQSQKLNAQISVIAVQHDTYGYDGSEDMDNLVWPIFSVQDLVDAADRAKPGSTLVFANNIKVPATLLDVGSDNNPLLTFNNPVNIDLGGFTVTFPPETTLLFNNPTTVPCAVEISNGTIWAKYLKFDLGGAYVNLTKTFITELGGSAEAVGAPPRKDIIRDVDVVRRDRPADGYDSDETNDLYVVFNDAYGSKEHSSDPVGVRLIGNNSSTSPHGLGPYFPMGDFIPTMPPNGFYVEMELKPDEATFERLSPLSVSFELMNKANPSTIAGGVYLSFKRTHNNWTVGTTNLGGVFNGTHDIDPDHSFKVNMVYSEGIDGNVWCEMKLTDVSTGLTVFTRAGNLLKANQPVPYSSISKPGNLAFSDMDDSECIVTSLEVKPN